MQRIVHRYDPPERFVAGTVGEPGSRTFFLQAREGRRVTSVALEKEQVAVLAGRVEEILVQAAEAAPEVAAAIAAAPADDAAPLDAPITEDFRVGTLVLAWQPGGLPGGQRLVIQAYAVADADSSDPADVGGSTDRADAPESTEVLQAAGPEGAADGPSDAELAELEAEVEAVRAEVDLEEALAEAAAGVDPLDPTEESTDALVVRLDPGAASAFARRCAAVVSAGRPPCPFCGRPLDPAGHICVRANGYRPARS